MTQENPPAQAYHDSSTFADTDNDDLTPKDMMTFITAGVNSNGLVGYNINAFNELMDKGIPHIITQLFNVDITYKDPRDQTPIDKERESIRIQFQFTDVKIGRPVYSTHLTGKIADLLPNRARLSGLSYSGPIVLAAVVKLTARYSNGREEVKRAEIQPFQVCTYPIMVGSNRCHTWNLSRNAKKGMEEDPNDKGGNFIIRGEWVVDLLENIRFNSLHVHENMHAYEIVRGEFISQPGGAFENSSQIIIRYMTSGIITIEINSTKFSKMRIPWFILFRVFGMTSDAEIAEQVVFDLDSTSPITTHMLEIIGQSLHLVDATFIPVKDELNREKLIQFLAEKLSKFVKNPVSYKSDDNAIQYLNERLLSVLDKVILPHMGQNPESRRRKLRFLGMLIHKMFLVEMGISLPSDRDSYNKKRVFSAGIALAKSFKANFNISVIGPILKSLKSEFKLTPFEELTQGNIVDAFRNPLSTTGADLNRTMEQSITSGNKTIVVKRRAIVNRVSTQPLERKNPTNTLSSMRTVNTHNTSNSAKQTDRADQMRRVHPSYIGYICVAQSADTGEKVGMSKQLAITADVCTAGDSLPLKLRLLLDPSVVSLKDITNNEIFRNGWARVFINGEWVGCCRVAHELVVKYRVLRRKGEIDPHTTIYWDPVVDEVEFWLDVGRVTRPLLIVYSNIEDYDRARERGDADFLFTQNTLFTRKYAQGIITGAITMKDLIAAGVCEYITPEEAENCYVAESLKVLHRNRHNVLDRFTHVDVEQAILGLAALISPYGNHTQPARVTYETNQARQTCSWYCNSWPYRADMNRFLQFYNEIPLVKTLTHQFVIPNGMNTIVAYMIDGGFNQEDSVIISQAFVDRGGFAGVFYRIEKAELEKGEIFTNPDITNTKNLKPGASYEKLVDGFVPIGTTVNKGDVLIGRIAKIQTRSARGGRKHTQEGAPDSQTEYIDHSIVYLLEEPAVVEDVKRPRGPNGEPFGLVKLRYLRPVNVGDKMSSRSGNKSIVAVMRPSSDMPFTDEGMQPDLIVNPHSHPSRMTNGQMIETSESLINARKGIITDGTAFTPVDVAILAKRLSEEGLRYNGCSQMYNGLTGEHYNTAIFIGPTYHQRLQKFVLDDKYAVGSRGPTDALTGQPLDGKRSHGGLRLGEMEKWVLVGQGAMHTLVEKTRDDSDGRVAYICRLCGNHAIYNQALSLYKCQTCGPLADIAAVDSGKSSMVFQHEMKAANVNFRLRLKPRDFDQ